ncbi:hypothetical protein G7Y79_00003g011800 [Physcia stellaris]|nr:hypothetical protein G7Y79_00003g011800 [Physcia stellaris]
MATMASPEIFMHTSGKNEPVWIHTEPYSHRPRFQKLTQDVEADVCIIGSGIAGISTAYELVISGAKVIMLEAREVLSGESGRTSGHLSNALDDGYIAISKKHGDEGAKLAAESHTWALHHVGEVSKKLGIECEYRVLPGYEISQYPTNDPKHAEEVEEMRKEAEKAKSLGLPVSFKDGLAIQGWDGKVDQRDAALNSEQATFHPTKYMVGVLKWLADQPNFSCFTHTRVMSVEEKGVEILGIGSKDVRVSTEEGFTITCKKALEATCVPLQKLSVVAQMEFLRTYCIAIRIPKGSVEDCVIYDQADPYKYVVATTKSGKSKKTGASPNLSSGLETGSPRQAQVDYQWSGQIFEPVDFVAFIGLNQGNKHIYIITGDSGNGLTHGVLGGKLIADQINGIDNPWTKLYNPKRLMSIVSSLPGMVAHDVQINAQYKRFLESDIHDIEDLARGTGGVLNTKTSTPVAVYKDGEGSVHKFSALCPHLKGVVCWNKSEESWDCPIHGSRFSKDGIQVMGPAKANLSPIDESGKATQQQAVEA